MTDLHPVAPEPPSILKIDQQARAWRKRLVQVWRGPNPRVYSEADREGYVAAVFRAEGMTGPLRQDRLELIYMATRREDPSWEAFVTLALLDYVEDTETLPVGERSAKLPYQLAWARAGYTLSERTGQVGGIHRFLWPDVIEAEL